MRRREFCRQFVLVGGAALLAPFIKACTPQDSPVIEAGGTTPAMPSSTATNTSYPTRPSPPTATAVQTQPTPSPLSSPATNTPELAPTAVGPMATIALVKTDDRSLGVRRAIELLGLNPVGGQHVLLKPNFNSADPAPGSTHPDTLRSLILALNDMGSRSITLGERSGMGDTRAVLTQTGVFNLADELGFEVVVYEELQEADWVIQQNRDFHWASGFAMPKMLVDSECVVQTCNLKTHRYGGHFTLSLKNSVGFVAQKVHAGGYNYMEELHNSPYQRQMIAEVNTAYKPALIVLDGVAAFVDGGPATGTLVNPSVVLAGTDRVAIDAVGVAILRSFGTTPQVSDGPIFAQEQIARAVELGLGVTSLEQIKFVTGDAESARYTSHLQPFLT